MPRIRTVKPELFKHEHLFDAERETGLPLRLAFIGLFTACDREGRFHWRPRTLKVECLPHDDIDFSRVLDALATRGYILKYEVEGGVFGCIANWKKHQFVNNRESHSTLPSPNKTNILTRDARVEDAWGTPAIRKGKEGKGIVEGISR
jgi:hypothetical protein